MIKATRDCFADPSVSLTIRTFAESDRRIKSKRQQISDLTNELSLLESQALEIYKGSIAYYKLLAYVDDVRDWLCMLNNKQDSDGNKLDLRRSYREKDGFDEFSKYLDELIGFQGLKITSIADLNFGQAKIISFQSHSCDWELTIPCTDNISLSTFRDYGSSCFQLKLSRRISSSTSEAVGETFDETELQVIFNKALEEL